MKRKLIIVLIWLIVLSSCTTKNDSVNQTEIKLKETKITLFPTSTSTPKNTPISQEEKDKLIHIYKIMYIIDLNANMLKQTATTFKTNELSEPEAFAAVLFMGMIAQSIDEVIVEISVPDVFISFWNQVISSHYKTKDLLSKWYNNKVSEIYITEQVKPTIISIEEALTGFEDIFSRVYGLDNENLIKTREESIQEFNETILTPNP